MNPLLLNYKSLSEFAKQYRDGVLGTEHLESGQKHFNKFFDINASLDWEPPGGYQGYVLQKDGVKYLIDFGVGVQPGEALPIKIIGETQPVAYRGDVYQLIPRWSSVRFRSDKRKTFRQLVDDLCVLGHSNPQHQKLLVLIALTQFMTRANFRISSPPGSGKDSSVQILGNLVPGCLSITNPTLAKLEYRSSSEWLVINEMMRIGAAEWRLIEQFLLGAGDLKPSLEKHSLGKHTGVADTLDISKLSLSIFYNDKENYPEEEYFDDRAHGAVKNRFPALRVHGHFTERFDKINSVNVETLVKDNMDVYKDLIYTLIYYQENLEDELSRFDDSILHALLPNVKQRHRDNLTVLLKAFDLYSETQDEFSAWICVLVDAMRDYDAMVKFDDVATAKKKRLGTTKWQVKEEELLLHPTYTKKLEVLKEPVKKVSGDVKVW